MSDEEVPEAPQETPKDENKVAKAIGSFGVSVEKRAAAAREGFAAKEIASTISRVIYAARALCVCGERLASPDGNGNWQCSRLLLNNAPTKACQRLPSNAKVYAEGSEELMAIVRERKEQLGIS